MSYVEDLFSLKGKVAVVTGGSGVLGGAMATALAKGGAAVAIMYHNNRQGAAGHAERIQNEGGQAMICKANVASKPELENARDEILSQWGKIHVLVNSTGTNSTTPILDIKEEEWDRIMDTNLKGVYLSSQVFGEHLIRQKEGGSIINISSASSEIPLSKVFTYGISKSGINNMTRFLAREWAPHNIRVNALMPGFFPAEQNRKILTEKRKQDIYSHTPMERYGDPEELAGALLWLASSNAASFVTGTIIPVDGGFTAMTI
ncbi:MAG: SDR family oxidoreductase [Balneolales bacterium]